MSQETRQGIRTSDKAGVPAVPEHTRPGPIFSPAVDIFENDNTITVLADMPGVKPADLEIDLRENVLTLSGRVAAPETGGDNVVLREYEPGTYFRQFSLAETIDQAKIDARLKDGVLRLELPKIERARPRQISVRSG